MDGGGDRADLLTRSIFAMLTADRLSDDLLRSGGCPTLEVTVNTEPAHFATANHLILADDGNVVFRLTRNHAFRTSGAGGEIDRQGPTELRTVEIGLFPEGKRVSDVRQSFGECRVLLIVLKRTFTDDRRKAFLNAFLDDCLVECAIDAVVLSRSKRIGRSGLLKGDFRNKVHGL